MTTPVMESKLALQKSQCYRQYIDDAQGKSLSLICSTLHWLKKMSEDELAREAAQLRAEKQSQQTSADLDGHLLSHC